MPSAPEKSETVKNGPIALGNLTALMLAAPAGGPDVTKALLDAGAKVNAEDVRQMTPLMLAVATDHADPRTVRLLLQRGADIGMKDRTGLTAADWAKKYNSPAILREFGLPRQKAQDARVIIPTSVLGKLDPKPAAARSIALLQQSSGSFFKEGGCGSCHAQNLTSMAVNAAAASHLPVNPEARAAELKGVQLAFAGFAQPLLQRGDPPVVDILLYAGFQMASENVAPDQTTDAMVHNIVAQQRVAGNWHVGLGRASADGRRRFLAHRHGDSPFADVRSGGPQGGTPEAHRTRGPLAGQRYAEDHRGSQYAASRLEVGERGSPPGGRRRAAAAATAARGRRLGAESGPGQRRLRYRPGAVYAPRTRRFGERRRRIATVCSTSYRPRRTTGAGS